MIAESWMSNFIWHFLKQFLLPISGKKKTSCKGSAFCDIVISYIHFSLILHLNSAVDSLFPPTVLFQLLLFLLVYLQAHLIPLPFFFFNQSIFTHTRMGVAVFRFYSQEALVMRTLSFLCQGTYLIPTWWLGPNIKYPDLSLTELSKCVVLAWF